MPLVYDELRIRARHYIARERPSISLQPTALVNEVYLKLIDAAEVPWQDRAHFFAIAAQMMRRILVDAARARRSAKRGGGSRKVELDEYRFTAQATDRELLALDDAIKALSGNRFEYFSRATILMLRSTNRASRQQDRG
jgi:RNA polymerase sigma factor (TIGR02999 family)